MMYYTYAALLQIFIAYSEAMIFPSDHSLFQRIARADSQNVTQRMKSLSPTLARCLGKALTYVPPPNPEIEELNNISVRLEEYATTNMKKESLKEMYMDPAPVTRCSIPCLGLYLKNFCPELPGSDFVEVMITNRVAKCTRDNQDLIKQSDEEQRQKCGKTWEEAMPYLCDSWCPNTAQMRDLS